jgi:hypothetical protein
VCNFPAYTPPRPPAHLHRPSPAVERTPQPPVPAIQNASDTDADSMALIAGDTSRICFCFGNALASHELWCSVIGGRRWQENQDFRTLASTHKQVSSLSRCSSAAPSMSCFLRSLQRAGSRPTPQSPRVIVSAYFRSFLIRPSSQQQRPLRSQERQKEQRPGQDEQRAEAGPPPAVIHACC